jgi:hypothetical protein
MRECGECQACCTLMGVRERGKLSDGSRYQLDKPMGERCAHQCASGCAIHNEERLPISCRIFECEWLHGKFREEERPDRSGLVVTLAPKDGETWAMVYGGKLTDDGNDEASFEIPTSGARTFNALLGDSRFSGIHFWSSELPAEDGMCVGLGFRRTPIGWEPCRIRYPAEQEWTEGDIERELTAALYGKPPWPHRGLRDKFENSTLAEKLKLRPWHEKRMKARAAREKR